MNVEVEKGTHYLKLDYGARPSDGDPDGIVYQIRGSYLKYQCGIPNSINNNFGKNCTVYNNAKASGTCYRTNFGDWKCNMLDFATGYGTEKQPPPTK